jgi:hypothetical protein
MSDYFRVRLLQGILVGSASEGGEFRYRHDDSEVAFVATVFVDGSAVGIEFLPCRGGGRPLVMGPRQDPFW